jgi:hypothetical protein
MSDSKTVAKVPAKKKAAPKKDLAKATEPQSQEQQVTNALMQSIESGTLQPEQLKMVLDAQERILDRQAKQAFAADMALCQAEMPAVIKSGYNTHTESRYEKIDDLNNAIKPAYTKFGFAVSFNTVSFNSCAAVKEDWIGMKATVSHKLGWSEEHTYELPMDGKGLRGNDNMTGIHGVASSRQYMRRYLLKEIFNITTTEDGQQDDDGNCGASGQFITQDQAIEISDLVTETKANTKAFLKFCGAPTIEEIRADRYEKAKDMLLKKKGGQS